VKDVTFDGAAEAQPTLGVVNSILNSEAVIICPSNPIVSIGPILSVKGIKNALEETKAEVIAISPIVRGSPIKGPANKLMRGLGMEVSAYAVANLYRTFLDTFIIDQKDQAEKERVKGLGIQVVTTDTIMKDLRSKVQLARVTLRSVGAR
jgi:LPPG:FO 2-phospho-L-lactate transferase